VCMVLPESANYSTEYSNMRCRACHWPRMMAKDRAAHLTPTILTAAHLGMSVHARVELASMLHQIKASNDDCHSHKVLQKIGANL
jgi:hypothetical protein